MRDVGEKIDGLPEGFSFHDLWHYLASLLIASGADIKTVQARMRHATATLDTYGHLWPADESTRSAIGAVIAKRMDSVESAAASALTGLHVEVQRELRPACLRVFAGVAVLTCSGLTCGKIM